MAKEDFCFTYYDGDATRDTAHMNRLERGGYHDLVIAQRKFGWLTLDQIKKILGKDHEQIFPAIELILKTSGEKYFIEWLNNSILKSKKHSKHQKENADKRWDANGNAENENGIDSAIPLKDGDGNEKGNDNENKADNGNSSFDNFSSSETSLPLEMLKIWEAAKPSYPVDRLKDLPALQGIKEFIWEQANKTRGDPHFETITDQMILDMWQQIMREFLKDKFWKNKSLSSFGNSIQEFWNKANKNGKRQDEQQFSYDKLKDLLGYGGQTIPHAN